MWDLRFRHSFAMKRRLLNLLTLLSLLLLIATLTLWAPSYTRLDGIAFGRRVGPGEVRFVAVYTGRGGMQWTLGHNTQDVELPLEAGVAPYGFFHWAEDRPEAPGGGERGEVVEYRHQAWGFGSDRFLVKERLFKADGGYVSDLASAPHLRG